MARKKPESDVERAQICEPVLPWSSVDEGTPVTTSTQPRLNGSVNVALEGPPEDHAIVSFLKSYGTIILAAAFGVLGSLAAAGFIMKPATSASVDDLKSSVATFIENHNKLDFVKDNFLKEHLQEINFGLKELLSRSRQTELQQARTDAKVEDVMRLLTPQLPHPAPTLDPDASPLPKRPADKTPLIVAPEHRR